MDKNIILGLETSCDETSAAVIVDGHKILSNVISSQIDIHQKYGGVVPELASRQHTENVLLVIDMALSEAGVTLEDLSGIGVTYGPGLVGALLVGVSAAKALAYAKDIPLVGVNHLEAHLYANFLEHPDLEPPLVALVVSGGHTSLIHVPRHGEFALMGQTRDDAAGEAFDKVARVLGLGYPGGPLIEQLAVRGNSEAIAFPRAFVKEGYEFSFSGLKSAVVNYLHNAEQREELVKPEDVAASFQAAVIDVLVQKTMQAARDKGVKNVVLAGGVAANTALKQALAEAAEHNGFKLHYPPLVLCTDNAAMVACRAYYQLQNNEVAPFTLNALPSLKLGT